MPPHPLQHRALWREIGPSWPMCPLCACGVLSLGTLRCTPHCPFSQEAPALTGEAGREYVTGSVVQEITCPSDRQAMSGMCWVPRICTAGLVGGVGGGMSLEEETLVLGLEALGGFERLRGGAWMAQV